MLETRFSADTALDCWRFGQHGELFSASRGKTRILLDDDQRRRLAVKGKVLDRKLLGEVGRAEGEIQCRKRLGGLLRYYCRDAA